LPPLNARERRHLRRRHMLRMRRRRHAATPTKNSAGSAALYSEQRPHVPSHEKDMAAREQRIVEWEGSTIC
jgi:hypothetical protein